MAGYVRRRGAAVAIVLMAFILSCVSSSARAAGEPRELWLYYSTNLLVDKNVDRLQEIWTRAAAAGYTHVLLADAKFARLAEMEGTKYLDHVRRVRRIGADANLKIVPALFSIGYSNDLLSRDPNLAEGLPVVDAPFVVRRGELVKDDEPAARFGRTRFVDPAVRVDGTTATVAGHSGNARMCYEALVAPRRAYHVSVRVKTEAYTGRPEIKVLAGERSLQFQNMGVKKTQDWTEHHVVFNSLDNERVNVYFGTWGDAEGTLQWRDWRIEEAGLVNVLRRPGTPVVVKGEDGRVYREGVDYEPVADPRMGNRPYAGEYEAWHAPPTIRTKLPDGTRLRVSWYHPAIVYDGQVSACVAEPKLDELLADQAARMKRAWGGDGGGAAAGWMMSHDEFRTLGWCKACVDTGRTSGQMLAGNVARCAKLLAPDSTYVWSDMFDPFHNAVKGPYYLVNGPWTGSWEGLPKDVVVMNWNGGKRAESLKFFAGRGHRQIVATYYDDPSLMSTRNWLTSAAGEPSAIGFMYTTWENDYSQLEAFAKLVRE